MRLITPFRFTTILRTWMSTDIDCTVSHPTDSKTHGEGFAEGKKNCAGVASLSLCLPVSLSLSVSLSMHSLYLSHVFEDGSQVPQLPRKEGKTVVPGLLGGLLPQGSHRELA